MADLVALANGLASGPTDLLNVSLDGSISSEVGAGDTTAASWLLMDEGVDRNVAISNTTSQLPNARGNHCGQDSGHKNHAVSIVVHNNAVARQHDTSRRLVNDLGVPKPKHIQQVLDFEQQAQARGNVGVRSTVQVPLALLDGSLDDGAESVRVVQPSGGAGGVVRVRTGDHADPDEGGLLDRGCVADEIACVSDDGEVTVAGAARDLAPELLVTGEGTEVL